VPPGICRDVRDAKDDEDRDDGNREGSSAPRQPAGFVRVSA
jgi:hypothetical protein